MKKILSISHSSLSDFRRCPELYHLQRTDKIKPKIKGASLHFGGAIDIALVHLLEHKKAGTVELGLKDYKEIFLVHPEKGWNLSLDHDGIRYSDKDFTNSLVENETTTIESWEKELGVTKEDCLKDQKQSGFKKISDSSQKMYLRLCWLSLKIKGLLMLEAFVRDMLPDIKEVIAIQHSINGELDTKNGPAKIVGSIDLICKYKNYDKPIIFDIKTAARPYKDNAIKLSYQLLMYTTAVGEELGTTLAGYMIMLKNMSSDDICSKCLVPKAEGSRHKTCNENGPDGERCKGEWKSIPKATTQIMVEELSLEQQRKFLTNIANIASIIPETRYQNLDSCTDFGLCGYYDYCHNKQVDKYIFPPDKIEIKEEPIEELTEEPEKE